MLNYFPNKLITVDMRKEVEYNANKQRYEFFSKLVAGTINVLVLVGLC